MAVSTDVAKTKAPTGDTTSNNSINKPSVVTPEGPKSAAEAPTALVADEKEDIGLSVSPPLTPPRVASQLPAGIPGSVEHPTFSPPQGLLMTVDAFTQKDDNNDNENNGEEDEEENASQADSSDGESSYFVKHLPSPKSGRRASYSSSHSASGRPTSDLDAGSNHNKPSDASLSFSDESDDDDLPHSESPEPLAPLGGGGRGAVADMQLQTITRVHSISSLVSSDEGSHASHPTAGVLSPNSSISGNSTSDPSVMAELSTVRASSSSKNSSSRNMPSGRRSPLPADAAFMGQYYSASPGAYHDASPPTIFPGYNVAAGPEYAGMLHPQPQMMMKQPQHPHGNTSPNRNNKGPSKAPSDGGTLNFVYSDDDETDDVAFMNQLAASGGGGTANAGAFSNGGGGRGGGGPADYGGIRNGSHGNINGNYQQPGGQASYSYQQGGGVMAKGGAGSGDGSTGDISDGDDADFQVYWQRWVMLFFMSLLNLLSDWTCYSVAPIAILTQETFGEIDPERLVVIFLGANAISTACEPIILARLGLKKTVLFGALLLTIGSIIKSGGLPPIIQSELVSGRDEWRLSLGFFLVGLSQPLYQCTPALLSASWFPEQERTMATGVALNANQLGIGCAFVFGTLLVATSDDIPSYFGLLSMISTITFFGTLFFFDDAPPTPPSSSAKVMKGDIVVPDMGSIVQSVRKMSSSIRDIGSDSKKSKSKDGSVTRRRNKNTAPAPSPANWESATEAISDPLFQALAAAPSPMMPGPTGEREGADSPLYAEGNMPNPEMMQGGHPGGYPMQPGMPYGAFPPQYPPQAYQNPYYDPRMQPQFYPPPPHPYYYGYQNGPPAGMYPPHPPYPGTYGYEGDWEQFDEGAEPVLTLTDHHLDINIRDDQVILSIRTCMARPGFIHSLVAFTVSGIVINTLSTYMDYLVTLNGAGREYVGIVGGSFQAIIMISSLVIGGQTDKTRAYYSVIICMLVMGAFGLAQCGVSLDADRGGDLRWSLIIVAALIGPLQPVSTELGVEVAYPLSENTVLVIQQLFSNLLSALFIPFFKSLKDIGIGTGQSATMDEKPQYTFSFYLLIVLHAGATIFFATFRGRYLRKFLFCLPAFFCSASFVVLY